ncbi:hypothetical protein ABPG77_004340 [Micractinium sp. CCAP 211/92]
MADGGEHAALLALEAAAHRDIQQLAATPLADKARSQRLSAGIQDSMARIRALTRDLELEVEEMDSDDERAALAAQLVGHKREYASLQAALKDAALAQRAAALRSAQEERKELLAGGEAGLRQRRAQLEGDAVAAAQEVTGGLRRTRQVLAEELEHTSATLAAMEASHAALGRTRDEYHGQHRKLRKSKGLLRTLNWQNKSETYMLWMGLTLFLAVCAYIAQKRAAHFIPEPLKPSNLLAGLMRSPRAGKPLAAPPAGRLRADTAPHAVRPPDSLPPPQQEEQQWREGDAEAAAPVGRGRAPAPELLRRPPLPAPEDAPTGDGGHEEAQATAQLYGGFTDEAEAEEAVQPAYQPPVSDGSASLLEQQAAEQEHPPAEWPSGAPEPEQGGEVRQQQQQAGEQQALPHSQQQSAKQGSEGPVEDQPAAAEQEGPLVDDLTLPAVDTVQAASMAADLAAGQMAAALQAAAGGQQGVHQNADASEAANPVQPAGPPAGEGQLSVDGRQKGDFGDAAEEQTQGQPAAEQAAQQHAEPAEREGEQAEQRVVPEQQQAEPEQQQAEAGTGEAQPGEPGEHASAEWPGGAPEPRDEL